MMTTKVLPLSSPSMEVLLPHRKSQTSSKSRSRRERQYVDVSPLTFDLAWVGTLLLHGICAGYYFTVGRVYAVTTVTSWLGSALRFYKWGIDPRAFPTVAKVHYIIGAVHCFIIAHTIAWSIYRRKLSFGPMQEHKPPIRRGTTLPSLDVANVSWFTRARVIVRSLFSRTGFFGVESEYFDVQRIVLELVEVVLLTVQAYRMSKYVPRTWLNNMFVGLLVTNCLVTPIIHVVVTRNALMRRVLTLVCDSLLDLFSTLVIPVILAVIYSKDYDPVLRGFGANLLLNDIWFVNASNEFNLILVTSFADLASRTIVAFGLIASLENAKALIRARQQNRQTSDVSSGSERRIPSLSIISASGEMRSWLQNAPWRKRLHAAFHLLLCCWGLAVVTLHIQAVMVVRLPSCAMQIRPWLRSKPTCALLLVNCYDDDLHQRTTQERLDQWLLPDEDGVVRVVIRHCPQYSMHTGTIPRMRGIKAFKVYNSSIANWPSEVAITHARNPLLIALMFVRVQFANNGELPDGLTSNDFPKTALSIHFCVTNLYTLPDDLDKKWPMHGFFLFENSNFHVLPTVVSRLQPSQLSFSCNRFTRFPFELLQVQGLKYLNLGGNPISSLIPTPANDSDSFSDPADAGSIQHLFLVGTNVSVLPRWLDPLLHSRLRTGPIGLPPLFVSGTPFCRNTALMLSGKLPAYPAHVFPAAEVSFAMNLTSLNATLLKTLSLCAPFGELFYPLVIEDVTSGLPDA